MIVTSMRTTTVEPMVCLRDGQATFFSSTLTSLRNCVALVMKLSFGLTGAGVLATTAGFLLTTAFWPTAASPLSISATAFAVAAVCDLASSATADSVFFFFLPGFLRC